MSICCLRRCALCLALGLLVGPACESRPTESPESAADSQALAGRAQTPAENAGEADKAAKAEIVALARDLHLAEMTEVVLDARGEAALTLDAEGGVRLWAAISSQEVKIPLVLPVYEPAWMSLAATEDGGFVAAFIDTAGGALVARVDEGEAGARFEVLFEIPTTDPQFELYVFDGGTRTLSLGQDHRIRLFDADGQVISSIDQASFVPWQLRVSPRPGQAPAIVAVLAGPTRVQPLEVKDDRLLLKGEARRVVIDRGPNRNDLSLSPDGRTMAALRRPRSREPRFTLEFVDLATDDRRLLVGETDNRELARLHWVDDERILLESGTGHGFWVALANAIPWTEETGREQTEELELVPLREVALPESAGSLRSHATVVAGLRVVPTAGALIIDPVDEAHHFALSSLDLRPRAVALDAAGARIAWSIEGKIVLDEIGGTSGMVEPRSIPGPQIPAIELAFVGKDELMVLDAAGQASLLACDDGKVIATSQLSSAEEVYSAGFRRDGAGRGSLALLDSRSRPSIRVLEVSAGGFGELRRQPGIDRQRWPELGVHRKDAATILQDLGLTDLKSRDIRALVLDARGHQLLSSENDNSMLHDVHDGQRQEIVLRQGSVQRLVPSPSGAKVAVVQHAVGFGAYAISVIDLDARDRAWTQPVTGFHDLDWSADGSRVAVAAEEGGFVMDAKTGELQLVRHHLGLEVVEVADPTL